jgi:anti-anti-sigma factor
MALDVTATIRSPGIFVVAPIGSIDGAAHGMLQEKVDSVLKQNPDVIIFDMEQADYINSMGIRVLVKTKNVMKHRGVISRSSTSSRKLKKCSPSSMRCRPSRCLQPSRSSMTTCGLS